MFYVGGGVVVFGVFGKRRVFLELVGGGRFFGRIGFLVIFL